MTTHKLSIFTVLTAISLLTLMACKTPQATLPKDNIKATLPTATTDTVTNVHVWRDFSRIRHCVRSLIQHSITIKT